MDKYIVYGDLNCPYSYAVHQKLKQLTLLDQVEFRLVEHAPDLGLYGNRPEILTELASDVFAVRSLAGEVPLALPPERPDSRFAILCIIAAQSVDRQQAETLRDLFYTALWVDGKDIACPSVIFNCIEKAGLPVELEVDEQCEDQLDRWHSQWDKSKVGSRIPAIVAPDNRKLLGLPSIEDLGAFFAGEESNLQNDSTKLQRSSSLHSIAILSTGDVTSIWAPLEAIRGEYNLLLPASMEELKQLFNSDNYAPDLVLLHADENWHDLLRGYQSFIERMKISYTPIAIVGAENDDSLELSAYAAGAADYIPAGRSAGILKARISMMLDLKKSRDFLERSARIDGLTGINNRREFEKLLEQEWRRSSRTNQSLALIMLDVDFFKPYNDSYGHLAGDSALRQISEVLQNALSRPYDAVCRYGGEEFAILMPETNISGAHKVAELVREAVMKRAIPHDRSSVCDVVTVSQGVASFVPSDFNSPMQLIQAADKALYHSKETCRNAVTVDGQYRENKDNLQ
ncbi:MAG: diguanylate cyclase [Pseudomonadales bacterium]|nr:diguanylate cyclase [Pseudomonadales bacterium]NRA15880.1 diguanylate cyclase [Oceanospirillaceae bacterium]